MKKATNVYFYPGRKCGKYVFEKVVNGERFSTSFSTLSAATAFAARFLKELREHGTAAPVLTAREREEWGEIRKICAAAGASPLAIVKEWAAAHAVKRIGFDAAFGEFEEFLRRGGRAEAYIRNAATDRRRIGAVIGRDVPLTDVSGRMLSDAIAQLGGAPKTQRNRRGVLLSFFGWARAAGYVSAVPEIDERRIPRERPKSTAVWTRAEAERAMRALEREFPAFVPHFALRLFAGLRRSEAMKMRWEWIDFERRSIRVPGFWNGERVCKTGDDWVLFAPTMLPETVFAWLADAAKKEGAIEAPTERVRKRLAELLGHPPQNVLRHTFATMHVGWSGAAAKSADVTRHTNTATFTRHYRGANQPPDEVAAFWALRPSGKTGKISEKKKGKNRRKCGK